MSKRDERTAAFLRGEARAIGAIRAKHIEDLEAGNLSPDERLRWLERAVLELMDQNMLALLVEADRRG